MTSSLPINHRRLFLSWILFVFFLLFAFAIIITRDDTSGEGKRAEGKHNSCSLLLFNFSHSLENCNARSSPNQAQSERGVFYMRTYMRSALFHMNQVSIREFTDWYHQLFKGTAQPKHKNTYFFLVTLGIFI